MLLPFTAVVMAAAPFISTTRGGAFIAAALLLAVAVFFAFAPEHQVGWRRWVGLGVCTTGALLGLYLGWEKLEPRVFKLVWARSLDLVAPLHDFALRLRLEVPSDAVTNWTHLASLSDVDRYPGNQPGAFTLTIGRGGELNVRLNRPDGAGSVSSVYLDFAKRAAGREVELVVSRRTDLKVEVDGQALTARKGTPGGQTEWDLPIEPRYLVFGGRSSPASGSFYRLLSVRLETMEKTAAMLDHTAQRPDAAREGFPQVAAATSVVLAAVEDAQNPERRFFVSNTADWSGREALYENARAMALRLPVLLGAGPGTFGALLLAYATVQGGAYHQHAHNDWLESRITLGAMVTGGLLLGLLVILLRPLQPGGGVMPPQLVWLIWLALGGVLVHARFDYPFQVHAIVNLVLVQLALLSGAESGAAVSR